MKKFITFLLTTALCLGFCTGCREKKTSNESGYDKKIDLTIWAMHGTDYVEPTYPKEDIPGDWLQSKTNVNIDLIYGNDGGLWETKLSKLVAGNNLPQIIFCGNSQGPAYFSKFAELDKIYELTPEMLEKYCPNIMKRVKPEFWEKIKVNGKIYGIPTSFKLEDMQETYMTEEEVKYARDCYPSVYNDVCFDGELNVRDDILKMIYPEAKSADELEEILKNSNEPIGEQCMDIPIDTTEDFVDFMYKIKELDLKTKNGKKVYAYGYNGGDGWFALAQLGPEMVGFKTHNYPLTWNTETNSIEALITRDVVKEAALLQNRMIRDKVADPESVTQTSNMFQEKTLQGQYAVINSVTGYSLSALNAQLEQNGAGFKYRPLYTNIKNRPGYTAKKEAEIWSASFGILKSVKEEDLPQILNWFDLQFSDEFDEIKFWGTKEDGLYEEKDGKRTFKDEKFQKYFVEGDTSALKTSETKGLGNGKWLCNAGWTRECKWNPAIYNHAKQLTFNADSGLAFPADSEHITNVLKVPENNVWSSAFGEIPEVVEYWGKREQWENPFILALTSETEADFENNWQKAIDNLNKLVNIPEMERKCTEAVQEQYEQIQQQ